MELNPSGETRDKSRKVEQCVGCCTSGVAGAEPVDSAALTNRRNPPDAILRAVDRRTSGQPFARIEDVISPQGMAAMSEQCKQIAGFGKGQLRPDR